MLESALARAGETLADRRQFGLDAAQWRSFDVVIGYHTLAVGQVSYEGAPQRLSKGLSRHPILIMLLARSAVDKRWQGQGVGKGLLKDAMQRTLQAADIAGIRAFAVHAKGEDARRFYEHFDFVPSPIDPLQLFILLKDVRALLG